VFSPGIIREMVAVLPAKLGNLQGIHREAMLNFDECSIVPALSWDANIFAYLCFLDLDLIITTHPRINKS